MSWEERKEKCSGLTLGTWSSYCISNLCPTEDCQPFCHYFQTLFCVVNVLLFNWTYLLTYYMVQSPSWETNWFAASQEIPSILWNPKVHYRTHKRPPPVPVLGQPNPVHIPTYHLLEIHLNIIHPSTPRSPQWSLSLQFPHQDPIQPPLLTHTRHMPSPSHSSRFLLFNWTETIITELVDWYLN